MSIIAPLLALALAGQQASPPPSLPPDFPEKATAFTVSPGGRIVFRINDDGSLRITKMDRAEAAKVLPPQSGSTAASPINGAAAGEVVVSMVFEPQLGALLKVENGLGYPIDYRAVMMARGGDGQWRQAPTSICTVGKGLVSYEHWPHPIDMLFLFKFERYDGAPHCVEPKAEEVPRLPTPVT